MKSVKALLIGGVFIVVSMLLFQLLYLFIVVAYNSLVQDVGLIQGLDAYLGLLLNVPVYLVIMFFGGYLTAEYAEQRVVLHGLLLGIATSLAFLAMAVQNAELSIKGLLVIALSISAAMAGSIYWRKGKSSPDITSADTPPGS